jgi:LacI family transcriptional regulator
LLRSGVTKQQERRFLPAIGLIQGFREKGCELPTDLPIAAYDDSDAASFTEPPLTTVKVPFYEMGSLAAAEKQILTMQGNMEVY